jgi:multiple antibiotic resistance protein
MPTLSGPGSIAVILGFSSLARHPLDYGAIILGILFVAAVTYSALRISGRIVT